MQGQYLRLRLDHSAPQNLTPRNNQNLYLNAGSYPRHKLACFNYICCFNDPAFSYDKDSHKMMLLFKRLAKKVYQGQNALAYFFGEKDFLKSFFYFILPPVRQSGLAGQNRLQTRRFHSWTGRPLGCWAVGPLGRWAVGPLGR
jgi:hypothetical protein